MAQADEVELAILEAELFDELELGTELELGAELFDELELGTELFDELDSDDAIELLEVTVEHTEPVTAGFSAVTVLFLSPCTPKLTDWPG